MCWYFDGQLHKCWHNDWHGWCATCWPGSFWSRVRLSGPSFTHVPVFHGESDKHWHYDLQEMTGVVRYLSASDIPARGRNVLSPWSVFDDQPEEVGTDAVLDPCSVFLWFTGAWCLCWCSGGFCFCFCCCWCFGCYWFVCVWVWYFGGALLYIYILHCFVSLVVHLFNIRICCFWTTLFSESEQWLESYVACVPEIAGMDSIFSLKKELTPKICMLCIVIINSILFDLLCVWFSSGHTQREVLSDIQCRTKSHLVIKRWKCVRMFADWRSWEERTFRLCHMSLDVRASIDAQLLYWWG